MAQDVTTNPAAVTSPGAYRPSSINLEGLRA
jgi:hypothetical protein